MGLWSTALWGNVTEPSIFGIPNEGFALSEAFVDCGVMVNNPQRVVDRVSDVALR